MSRCAPTAAALLVAVAAALLALGYLAVTLWGLGRGGVVVTAAHRHGFPARRAAAGSGATGAPEPALDAREFTPVSPRP
ncbi:hypothetical protein ACFWPU_06310 [Streptomyces sp. NPDC058471]|uniref:hypothetical protein n=1 Tax=Streptomyces sp. NPDC058471 TaxID=3346516 RepID=UPI003660C319